jgi:Ca2+/Na+ antiporter
MINPIQANLREIGPALIIGTMALLLTFPRVDGQIKRTQGIFLILLSMRGISFLLYRIAKD